MSADMLPCPCCGYKTLDEQGKFSICPVCYWEDDPLQSADPDQEGFANPMSLRQAQKNFLEIGACEGDMKKWVRKPKPEEDRDEGWTQIL